MRRTLKAVAGLCVLTGTLFFASGGAVSAQECGGYFNPCVTETLTFEYPRTVRALQVIHITGLIDEQPAAAAKASDDTVEFVLAGQAIGSTPVNADGTFEGDFTVPNVAPAEYDITATSGTLSTTGPITVIADAVNNNSQQQRRRQQPAGSHRLRRHADGHPWCRRAGPRCRCGLRQQAPPDRLIHPT